MPPPIVSVIVPAYNAETTIRQTLQSAFSQTVTDIEVIVVDDGSVDGTLRILRSIDDPRITVIEQENAGVGAARHAAVLQSSGLWLAFLDADDEWTSQKLAIQLDQARRTGARLVHTAVTPIGNCDDVGLEHVQPPEEMFEWLLLDNQITLSSVMLSRDAYDNAGGFDPCRSRSGTEDWDLWLRLAANDLRFAFCTEQLTRYRWSQGNQSANSQRMHSARRKTLAEALKTPTGRQISKRVRRRAWRNLYLTSAWFGARNGHKLAALRWLSASLKYGVDPSRIKVVLSSILQVPAAMRIAERTKKRGPR